MYKRILIGLAAMMFSVTAVAQLQEFYGGNAGAVRINADNAFANFVAAFPAGTINVDDFESYPGGVRPVVMNNSVTLQCSGPGLDGNEEVQIVPPSAFGFNPAFGYNTTVGAGNVKFLRFYNQGNFNAATCTFTFGNPVQAWGMYITGNGSVASTVDISYSDGTNQSTVLTGFAQGGTEFYGFTHPGKFITAVSVNTDTITDAMGLDDMVTVESTNTARFTVTKNFIPDSDAPVNVAITCNDGQPNTDTATITENSPHTFVITGLTQNTGTTCTITEENLLGYNQLPEDGCVFNDVGATDYDCAFRNTALPVTFGFTKIWDTAGAGSGGIATTRFADLTINCNANIDSFEPLSGTQLNNTTVTWDSTSADAPTDYSVAVIARGNTPVCTATDLVLDSSVEVTETGRCRDVTIPIGESITDCEFRNTVFFEGIPTLSQYGLAIMALLMLGVGFVGLRRFV